MENQWIDYKIYKNNNIIYFLFNVKKELPTSMEWTFAIEDFKTLMSDLKSQNIDFGFILDIRKMSLVSISQIKEFVNLLQSMSDHLESKLIASSIIAQGNIIKSIFEIVKIFYNTKKPLKIVNNFDEAYLFMEECKF